MSQKTAQPMQSIPSTSVSDSFRVNGVTLMPAVATTLTTSYDNPVNIWREPRRPPQRPIGERGARGPGFIGLARVIAHATGGRVCDAGSDQGEAGGRQGDAHGDVRPARERGGLPARAVLLRDAAGCRSSR